MNWNENKTLVIAHRGHTSGPTRPQGSPDVENTLPALQAALKLGVDGIETDLRLTRDGHIVLCHDHDMKRLTKNPKLHQRIEETDLRRLRELSKNFFHLTTLEELLDLAGGKILLNLEIKTVVYAQATLEKKLIHTLRHFSLLNTDSVLISSFHPLPLLRLRFLAPQLARGYLLEKSSPLYSWVHSALIPLTDPFSLNVPASLLSPRLMRQAHAKNRKVLVWTVNEDEALNKCLQMKVDGIISDQPGKALEKLNRIPRMRSPIKDLPISAKPSQNMVG